MSESYNPETKIHEQIESLEIEARTLVQKRDASSGSESDIFQRQLTEIENRIALLKANLKS